MNLDCLAKPQVFWRVRIAPVFHVRSFQRISQSTRSYPTGTCEDMITSAPSGYEEESCCSRHDRFHIGLIVLVDRRVGVIRDIGGETALASGWSGRPDAIPRDVRPSSPALGHRWRAHRGAVDSRVRVDSRDVVASIY